MEYWEGSSITQPIFYYTSHSFFLFRNQIKVRNYLILGLTVLIFLLVAFSLIGKVSGLDMLYQISYDAFQKLFGLPFLFIEDGRILYKDVMDDQAEKLNQ